MAPDTFVSEHTALVRPLFVEDARAWWDLNTTGAAEHQERSRKAREEIARIYADAGNYEQLVAWDDEGVSGRQLARQVRLLRLMHAAEQKDEESIQREAALSTELEAVFSGFRPEVLGVRKTQNQLVEILRTSTGESERRAAWEASMAVGREVEAGILELVSLRNAVAEKLGYRSFYAMSLDLSEIDEDHLLSILDELEERTEGPFAEEKATLDAELAERLGCDPAALMPWHYADPFFQECPPGGGLDLDAVFAEKDLEALTVRTYDGLGLEVRSVLTNSDLYPRDGKNQHAFCVNVDREGDVRVLANVVPNQRWMATMLHEFGHAVYDRYISPDLPFLLKEPAHPLTTEAVAMLMQRLPQDESWLAAVPGVPEEEASSIAGALAARARREKLIEMRWFLVMCRFERRLYEEPDHDRNGYWFELKERLQGLRRPEGRDEPDWAAKIHFAVAPVYYQNYLLGELVASQLSAWLSGVSSSGSIVDSRAAGRALVDKLFRPGRLRDWQSAVEHATGEPLDPRHYLTQYDLA